MLDKIITDLIVWKNVRKIAPQGKLYYFNQEGPSLFVLKKKDSKMIVGYNYVFLFNDAGIIQHAGAPNLFPKAEDYQDKLHVGRFEVEQDMDYLRKIAKSGTSYLNVREERIIHGLYPIKTLEKVRIRLNRTMETFNAQFGFNPDYTLFSEGSFLEDEPLF